ncbi:MAG: glycosyltransferase family 4 protein [Candidatus Andersenbacteria bacterium]
MNTDLRPLTPKKIVMTVANEFTTDYRVFREASALTQAGYDVTVLCVYRAGLPRSEERAGVHIRRVLDQHLRLPVTRRARAVRRVWWQALVAAKADLYHAHDRDTLDLTARVARRFNVPFIYDSHEFWPDKNQYENNTGSLRDRLSERWWTAKERRYARQASASIMTSEGHARGLRLLYSVAQPVLVRNIPEYQRGQDKTYFRKRFGLKSDDFLILYSGNIQRNRGLEQVLAALRLLPKHCHLVIVGYGPYAKTLEQSLAPDLRPRVHFHAAIPFTQLVAAQSSADLGVAPFQANCFSHRHVLPNKPFEYMMAELPVAVSALPELSRLVQAVGYGEVFKPDEPKDIARVINGMLHDPARLQRYRERARTASETTYRWDKEKLALLRLYKRIVP